MRPPYQFEDYRAAFLAILQGLIAKSGIMMADEGHFRVACSNAHGLAVEAAKSLHRESVKHVRQGVMEHPERTESGARLDLTEDGGL